MLASQLCILRVYGLPASEVRGALRAVQAEGCSGLRLLERDGEYAVCIQVSAPTQAMADEYCAKWTQKLRDRFGDAVFGTGDISLAQATLDALLQKRRLLVAADESTGRLIGARLQPLEHSEAVYDFGTQTWADRNTARKITTPESLLQKFPGDVVQAAAGRAQLALSLGGADYAVVYMPATVGQAPFVLLCDKRSAVACAVNPEESDAAIANDLLDLVRRRALGIKPLSSAIVFRPGHERPLLLLSAAGQARLATGRFTLRRPKQEPAAKPPHSDAAPTGTITFEPPVQPAPAAPATPAKPQTQTFDVPLTLNADTQVPESVTRTLGFETPPQTDPLDFTTAGPGAAAASRAARSRTNTTPRARQPRPEDVSAPARAQESEPAPSLLDGDIPDFSAGLDPAAIAAAMEKDAQSEPRSAEDLEKAASMLFDKVNVPETPAPRSRRTQPHDAAALKRRSLEVIEKSERRRRRNAWLGFFVFLLVVGLVAGGVWYFLQNDLGMRPSPKNYGTASFDTTAQKYLANGMRQMPGVSGYLALSGLDGQFVYAQDQTEEAAASETPAAVFETENWLGSATPSNTVIRSGASLAELEDTDSMQQNTGLTLYLPGGMYRCKVVGVYYLDDAGADGFDPASYTDLSNYYDYLDFVLEVGTRTLYDTGVSAADGESFLTLIGQSSHDGVSLCVTARLVGEKEDTALNTTVSENADALLTGTLYAAEGKSAPDRAALMSTQLDRYTALTAARAGSGSASDGSDTASSSGTASSTEIDESLQALREETDALIASADKLLAGLTDIAGQAGAAETDINQGAEGSLPEQTVTVDSLISSSGASSDSTSGETSQDGDTSSDASSSDGASSDSAPSSDSSGSSSGDSAGQTINVTMNGTAQTMDLVTCLAMVAQNELGPNAPMEAYKAQCVATHSWILSQSGYPSVLGSTPGSNALAAAQAVANVVVTYGGNVAFTPYFASASTGTASSADVWGGARAWLVPVDSPCDQQVASNWNTNGYNTGCARFARQTLQDRILEKMGVDLSGVDPNNWFTILSANQYGWVSQMQIGPNASGNDTCSGRWFREVLTAGCSVDGRSLRSQCFTVEYDADLDCFIFDVYGYGHGCGMSQWGAIGYARNGWTYDQILLHYYPGTSLVTIG